MFDDVVANIVAVGALIILTVFGLGLLSTLAEPTSRGPPYRPYRPEHHHHRPTPVPPSPRPDPNPHDRPHHKHHHHTKHSIGGCGATRYGCCPDGRTARDDDRGSNCPNLSKIGAGTTQTVADPHGDTPAYATKDHHHKKPSASATDNDQPGHASTPASTLLLISESPASTKEGFIQGLTNAIRKFRASGPITEGLTAKEQSEADENEEARIKTIESSAKKVIDKCCFNSNKEIFDKFATLMDATAAQMVKDLVGQAPHAIQTKDYTALQNGQKKIEDLTNLASAARKLSDIGPASI